jgi:hypothetical protein
MTDVLELFDLAHLAHRREAVRATVALLDDLLARGRQVHDLRTGSRDGTLTLAVDDARIRLAMPSAAQSQALRDLCRRGPVVLALGLALDDGRAMLGFSGVDEDLLISTRVGWDGRQRSQVSPGATVSVTPT